jgi:hypothetical protein
MQGERRSLACRSQRIILKKARKDSGVNEHKRLPNINIRHILKQRNSTTTTGSSTIRGLGGSMS